MNALIYLCLRFAAWLLRNERAEWARAMRSEFQHVDEHERLSWSLGCVIAAIKQRWAPMKTGDFRVSRVVMFIETLGCFGFLTMGWYEITFGPSGLVRLNGALIEKVFFSYPGGAYLLWSMIATSVVGLLGPIGLFLGLRYVLLGRALANHTFGWTLIGVTLGCNVIGTIAGIFVGPPDFYVQPGIALVGAVMPAAGIFHLMYLARPAVPPRTLVTA